MSKLITLLLAICFISANAQIKTKLSAPIDIPEEGWNKAVLIGNGNTLLFHFQYHRSIVVKVFDSTGTEVSSKKHECSVLDVNSLEESDFKGLYDINGEAVLFIQQYYLNKLSLIRLRFDPTTGNLLQEDVVTRAKSFKIPTIANVANDPSTGGYFVISLNYEDYNGTKRIVVDKYDKLNKLERSYPVDLDPNIRVKGMMGMQVSNEGHLLFTMDLFTEDPIDMKVVYPYLGLCYLPKGYDKVISKVAELAVEMTPLRVDVAYNKFYQYWNVLLSCYWDAKDYQTVPIEVMLVYDQSLNVLTQENMNYNMLNDEAHAKIDSSNIFVGYVHGMYTSDYGVTTLVKTDQHITDSIIDESANKTGYIGVTHINELGEEIGGVLLPRPYFDSRSLKYDLKNTGIIFKCKSLASEQAQVHMLNSKGHTYFLYNDANENFTLPLSKKGLALIDDFDKTNAMCMYVSRKRELRKEYLFKPMSQGVYTTIVGSSNYLELKRKYAVIVRKVDGNERTFHIGWVTFPEKQIL